MSMLFLRVLLLALLAHGTPAVERCECSQDPLGRASIVLADGAAGSTWLGQVVVAVSFFASVARLGSKKKLVFASSFSRCSISTSALLRSWCNLLVLMARFMSSKCIICALFRGLNPRRVVPPSFHTQLLFLDYGARLLS